MRRPQGFLLCIPEGFLAPEELEQGQQATAAEGIGCFRGPPYSPNAFRGVGSSRVAGACAGRGGGLGRSPGRGPLARSTWRCQSSTVSATRLPQKAKQRRQEPHGATACLATGGHDGLNDGPGEPRRRPRFDSRCAPAFHTARASDFKPSASAPFDLCVASLPACAIKPCRGFGGASSGKSPAASNGHSGRSRRRNGESHWRRRAATKGLLKVRLWRGPCWPNLKL